ncbi:MAG: oligosaccharide flippase family protein [Filomicrobium sp.]
MTLRTLLAGSTYAERLVALARARSSLALVDQGVVSGMRFGTSLIIGRLSGPADLGLYAIAFATLLFALSVQESLIMRPYTVFGQRMGPKRLKSFAGSALFQHGLLALASVLFLSVSGLALLALELTAPRLAHIVLILTLVIPFALSWDFARRMAFAHLRMEVALAIDIALAVLQLGILLAVASLEMLYVETALLVIALATAIVGAAWLFYRRHNFVVRRRNVEADTVRNWRFGRWILGGQLVAVLHGYTVPLALNFILGAQMAGIFIAGETLALLSNPVLLGLSNWLSPRAAAAYASGGIKSATHITLQAILAIWVLIAPLAVVFFFFGDTVLTFVYGAEYAGHGWMVAILGLCPFTWGTIFLLTCGLFAIEKADQVFAATFAGFLISLLLVFPLTQSMHLPGAALALLIGSSFTALFLAAILVYANMGRSEK